MADNPHDEKVETDVRRYYWRRFGNKWIRIGRWCRVLTVGTDSQLRKSSLGATNS